MRNLPPRAQGLIAINLTALLFGSSPLYGKLPISPFWIIGGRAFFAAFVLGILCLFQRKAEWPTRLQSRSLIWSGLILAVNWVTFCYSVQWGGVAVATLTFSSFPLFTMLWEAWHHRRRLQPIEGAAGVAIIGAVGLLIGPCKGQSILLGTGIGLISAFTFVLFSHSTKQLGKKVSPVRISFFQNGVVTLALAPFLKWASPMPHRMSQWLCLVLMAVLTTVVMHQLYFYSLRRLSAKLCSGFVALEPVYAILFAALFFREPITGWIALSALMVVGASLALLRIETEASEPVRE